MQLREPESESRNMRVLIVDDEPGVRSLLGKILNRAGSVCEMAGTAEEALERVDREQFDIALLDVHLPGMDGLSLAALIAERHPDIALVMVTSHATFEAALAAMQAGAVDYLVKPCGAEAVLRAYKRAAGRRQMRLDANTTHSLQQSLAERTLGIGMLLARPGEPAPALAAIYLEALRARHAEAAAHSERVGALATAIGSELGVRDVELDHVTRVAILHDLGKLALPDALLFRREPLTDDAVQIVKRFPEFGSDVLRRIPALADCAHAIFTQLEHYDGSGAPLGLRGPQIPLAARILAVANVYDVMTHSRPYAAEQTSVEALQELEACSGAQFDPDVVAALFEVMKYQPAGRQSGNAPTDGR